MFPGFPEILNNSGCEVQSELLTCVCISKGFPLPTIKWPLLKNHTEYSVITRVSNHTVHSTFTLTVKDHSSAVTECVSSSDVGEVRQNITIVTSEKQEGEHTRESAPIADISVFKHNVCSVLFVTAPPRS